MTGRCTGGQHHAPTAGGACPCGAVSRHPVAVPVRAGDEEIAAALAEVLEDQFSYATSHATVIVDWDEEAAALLPTVHRIAEQRAAEELRDAADLLTDRVRIWVLDLLHNRADVVEAGGER